jgi:hypothetical protein
LTLLAVAALVVTFASRSLDADSVWSFNAAMFCMFLYAVCFCICNISAKFQIPFISPLTADCIESCPMSRHFNLYDIGHMFVLIGYFIIKYRFPRRR